MWETFIQTIVDIYKESGIANMDFGSAIMILVACGLMFLAIRFGFEPLLLIPIAFGMLLANLPLAGLYAKDPNGQLIQYLYLSLIHI